MSLRRDYKQLLESETPSVSPRLSSENAQMVLEQAQKIVSLSSNNPPYKIGRFAERRDVIEARRQAGVTLRAHLSAGVNVANITAEQQILYTTLLNAFVAEATSCGNCEELGAVALSKLVELGIRERTELISVNILASYGEDAHTFALLNRDEQESDLQNPQTWRNVTLLDPWGNRAARVFTGDNTPLMTDVALLQGNVTGITSKVALSSDFNAEDCETFIRYLSAIKSLLNNVATGRLLANLREEFVESEYDGEFIPLMTQRLNAILDAKILLFSQKLNELRRLPVSLASNASTFYGQANVKEALQYELKAQTSRKKSSNDSCCLLM